MNTKTILVGTVLTILSVINSVNAASQDYFFANAVYTEITKPVVIEKAIYITSEAESNEESETNR